MQWAATGSKMNNLSDLIVPEAILPRLSAPSRKQALQAMAEVLGKAAGLEPRVIFDAILIRERLSGTGVGEGVAYEEGTRPRTQARFVQPQIINLLRLDKLGALVELHGEEGKRNGRHPL